MLVLGTMLFGGPQVPNKAEALEQIKLFIAKSGSSSKPILDTARLYQQGLTEQVLGELFRDCPELVPQVEIHTKADPGIAHLNRAGLELQLETSLAKLGVQQVDVWYMHMPDTSVSLEETFEACDALHKRGLFKRLGLSNYPAWTVAVIHGMCTARGWVKPTIYQGVYHLFSRSIEYELVPVLRYLNIQLFVFSPLCGGLLTGKYDLSMDKLPVEGRFSPQYHNHHLYLARYWNREVFKALEMIGRQCQAEGLSMLTVTWSWLKFHSKLVMDTDGLVFSASSLAQLEENLECFANCTKLSPSMLEVLARVGDLVYPVQAQYYRGYDKQHGRADKWLEQYKQ